jgi:hypothetical protein
MTPIQVQYLSFIFTHLNTCPKNLQKTMKKTQANPNGAIYIFAGKS